MAFIRKTIILLLLLCFQTGFSQNDCINAIVSCGSTNFHNLAVEGAGIQEVSGANSCGSGEFNSLWIKVTIKTPGTLGFIITPESTALNVDFDFYVFGPGPDYTCGNLGTAISCSTTNPLASGANSNLTGMIETETDYMEGPAADGNNYVRWMDVLADEIYYIVIDRAIGNGNFSLDWLGTATFSDPPVINGSTSGVLNLSQCDSDAIADESTAFDLTQNGTIAIGSQSNLIASYYLNESDATTGTNAIVNPTGYSNISNPQTLFIRLQNAISGCFTLTSFSLTVTPFNLPDITDLEQCDDDNDGYAVYNLSGIRNLMNINPNNVISFHHTATDTVNLPDNYTNQVAFTNETLWVKVYNASTGCTAYKSFNLILNSTPTAVPSQITQCDFEVFPDGITTFNLSQANSDLTNGDNALTTKFYLNATDAANDQNALNTTTFSNTVNPQILTVRVTNPSTGCYSLTQLTLNASVNPTTTVMLQSCDDNAEDGIATFNLADAGFEITGNTVAYYHNINEALMEQNPISGNQFSEQNIYARVENGNDCIGIHIIRLEVFDLPEASIDIQGILCANLANHPATLHTVINNPTNYDFAWSNGATTQNITVFQPGDYTVTVTDVISNCVKTVTVHLDASEAPTLETVEVNDLVQINAVNVIVSGNGDYWYSLDNGIYQQSGLFSPVVPGVHMVSIQDMNGCGTINQIVYVLGIPYYFTPNGDGYQDYWQIKGLDMNVNRKSKIYIFNRYGKVLTQFGPEGVWDGTYNGHLMPADDYWYSIQFEDGRNVKGHFALKR